MLKKIFTEDSGILTFEWIMLMTVLTVGVIAGLAAVRDAFVVELAETAQAAANLKQSYDSPGLTATTIGTPNMTHQTFRSVLASDSDGTVEILTSD